MTVQIAVKIAIGGESAGGCLAAATVLYAKNNNINICFQMLVYPVLDCQMKTQSAKNTLTHRFGTPNLTGKCGSFT